MAEHSPESHARELIQEGPRHGPTRRTHFIVLQYIDCVKHRRDQPDYPFSSEATIDASLDLLIRQYGLTTRKRDGTVELWTPKALRHQMPHGLFRQPDLQRTRLWSHGSDDLSKATIEKMQNAAHKYTNAISGSHFGDFPVLHSSQDIEKELERILSSRTPTTRLDQQGYYDGQQPHDTSKSLSSDRCKLALSKKRSWSGLHIDNASSLISDENVKRRKTLRRSTKATSSQVMAEVSSNESNDSETSMLEEHAAATEVRSASESAVQQVKAMTGDEGAYIHSTTSPSDSQPGSPRSDTKHTEYMEGSASASASSEVPHHKTLLSARSDTSKTRNASLFTPITSNTRMGPELQDLKPALEEIAFAVKTTVDSIFDQVGLKQGQDSPCSDNIDEALLSLFELCFGASWGSVWDRLYDSHRCLASDFVQALVAGFLFREIWTGGFNWMIDLCESAHADPITATDDDFVGSVVPGSRELKNLRRGLSSTKKQRRLEAERQVQIRFTEVVSAHDPEVNVTQLKAPSTRLAKQLESTLQPHLQSLFEAARPVNPRRATRPSRRSMQKGLAKLIKKSLQLKIKLSRPGIQHQFVWPSHGRLFDTTLMKHQYDQTPRLQCEVAFTLFPGLQVDLPNDSRTNVVIRHAVVVSMPKTDRGQVLLSRPITDHSESQDEATSFHRSSKAPVSPSGAVQRVQLQGDAPKLSSWDTFDNGDDLFPPASSLDEDGQSLSVKPLKENSLDLSSDPDRMSLHPQELHVASALRLTCAEYLGLKRQLFVLKAQAQAEDRPFNSNTAKSIPGRFNVVVLHRLWRAYTDVGWFDDKWFNGSMSTVRD